MSTDLTTTFGLVGDGVTDNHPMYINIRAFYAGVTQPPYLDLILDAGSYHCTAYASFIDDGTTPGIQLATITCTGATMLQAWIGSDDFWSDNLHSARVNSVNAGASTVILKNSALTSIFTVGAWCMMSCIDMQGYGFPANPYIFEYLQVQSVGANSVTFTTSLVNSYKDTYPVFWAGDGSNQDQGGPATLYVMHVNWPADLTWNNLTVGTSGGTNQYYGPGRKITLNNCTFYEAGYIPTGTQAVYFNGGSIGEGEIEVDKCVSIIQANGTAFHQVLYQSPLATSTYTNCSFNAGINGTGKNTTFDGCSIATSINIGPIAYGYAETLTVKNTTVGGPLVLASGDNVDISTIYTWMGGGIIRYLKSNGPRSIDTPGAIVWFSGSREWGSPFKIMDYTEDGTYVYYHTTLTVWPNWNFGIYGSQTLYFRRVNCKKLYFSNNTTSDLDIIALGRTPKPCALYEYNDRMITGAWSSGLNINLIGAIQYIVVDVQVPYTGTSNPATAYIFNDYTDSNFHQLREGGSITIDFRTAGKRTIAVGSVTGSRGVDSLGSPLGYRWSIGQIGLIPNFNSTSEAPGVQPTVFFQILADQGIDTLGVTPAVPSGTGGIFGISNNSNMIIRR
jgi:hypothetical protein